MGGHRVQVSRCHRRRRPGLEMDLVDCLLGLRHYALNSAESKCLQAGTRDTPADGRRSPTSSTASSSSSGGQGKTTG
uniref:Uncharacterized protein n=1 Tax=Hyaloperonospora arabidopsidis (strain Emoy2) TaxID=559515 RepID=M4B833_HYAAE